MWNYLINIIMIVIISSIIIIIIPEGRTTGIISVVLSIIVVLTLVSPLKDFNLDVSIPTFDYNIEIDYSYAEHANYLRSINYANDCIKVLEKEGINNAEIQVIYQDDEFRRFNIKFVKVFLENEVINSNEEHIDIIDKVKTLISERLIIEKGQVIIVEK